MVGDGKASDSGCHANHLSPSQRTELCAVPRASRPHEKASGLKRASGSTTLGATPVQADGTVVSERPTPPAARVEAEICSQTPAIASTSPRTVLLASIQHTQIEKVFKFFCSWQEFKKIVGSSTLSESIFLWLLQRFTAVANCAIWDNSEQMFVGPSAGMYIFQFIFHFGDVLGPLSLLASPTLNITYATQLTTSWPLFLCNKSN